MQEGLRSCTKPLHFRVSRSFVRGPDFPRTILLRDFVCRIPVHIGNVAQQYLPLGGGGGWKGEAGPRPQGRATDCLNPPPPPPPVRASFPLFFGAQALALALAQTGRAASQAELLLKAAGQRRYLLESPEFWAMRELVELSKVHRQPQSRARPCRPPHGSTVHGKPGHCMELSRPHQSIQPSVCLPSSLDSPSGLAWCVQHSLSRMSHVVPTTGSFVDRRFKLTVRPASLPFTCAGRLL